MFQTEKRYLFVGKNDQINSAIRQVLYEMNPEFQAIFAVSRVDEDQTFFKNFIQPIFVQPYFSGNDMALPTRFQEILNFMVQVKKSGKYCNSCVILKNYNLWPSLVNNKIHKTEILFDEQIQFMLKHGPALDSTTLIQTENFPSKMEKDIDVVVTCVENFAIMKERYQITQCELPKKLENIYLVYDKHTNQMVCKKWDNEIPTFSLSKKHLVYPVETSE